MRLAAIYNLFDGEEHLRGSMNCIKDHVDVFIIVWQDISNYGEQYNPMANLDFSGFKNVVLFQYLPAPEKGAHWNEVEKRNIGINLAHINKCTHFLHMDCDEYYDNFGLAKKLYSYCGKEGSVLRMYAYFQKPTLRFEYPENYYVPFIHKLTPVTKSGSPTYPYYVDPTRKINTLDVTLLENVYMHHFSWVRLDIQRKIRNSTARHNILISSLEKEYMSDLREGSTADGGKKLIEVPNQFNIIFFL